MLTAKIRFLQICLKKLKMAEFLKIVFLMVISAYVINGQAMFQPGPCPTGRQVGDRWYVGCTGCYCNADGYGCTGCGLIMPGPGCTIVRNNTARHPDCCPRMVCPAVG